MNEAKLQEFMGKLVGDMGGAAIMANVILGDEPLYRAMADGQPVTPEALAGAHRLASGWCASGSARRPPAVAVEHADGRSGCPSESWRWRRGSRRCTRAGGASVLCSMFLDKDKLVAAMRGNGALSWADHHPAACSRHRAFLPPGLQGASGEQLVAGAGRRGAAPGGRAKVADVGCGHGRPRSSWRRPIRSRAFMVSIPCGIDRAGAAARGCGWRRRPGRIGCATASGFPAATTTWCASTVARHGSDPVGGAARPPGTEARGTVLLVEPFANDALEQNLNWWAGCSCGVHLHLHAELASQEVVVWRAGR